MTLRNGDASRNILRQYARNIVCIDDAYQGAYSGTAPEKMEQRLYEGLSGETGAFVTMRKYENDADACAALAEKADMVILDWELEEKTTEDRFIKTLDILERLLKSRCSLICIYTQIGDERQVYDQVQLYFSGRTEKELDDLRKRLVLGNLTWEEWEERATRLLDEGEGADEIIRGLENLHKGNEAGEDIPSAKEILAYLQYQVMQKRWSAILPEKGKGKHNIARVHHDHRISGLNIDGKLLTVFHKMKNSQGEELQNPVRPADVFERFAQVIVEAPNSFFSVVWMAYQNMVREALRENSLFLDTVPDKMLRYLQKSREDAFFEELKDHFSQDLIYRLSGMKFEDEPQLLCAIDGLPDGTVENEDIIRFNAFYSQYRHSERSDSRIRFGDLFIVRRGSAGGGQNNMADDISDQIVVCITAHCDCENGTETTKICNSYSFAIQTENMKKKDAKVLESPESPDGGLYDFIRKDEGDVRIVKWDDNFMELYIRNPVIRNGRVSDVVYKKHELELEYIGTMKENYAQRIANRLFSHATRVGITYLGRRKQKDSEGCHAQSD